MHKLVEILLVEDCLEDVDLTVEALETLKIRNNLSVVHDGVEAMAFLRQEGKYKTSPRPSLVLLDLNMPKKSGHEVLLEMKSDPSLKEIPVVILTTSKADEDIAAAYSHHANCYVSKPVTMKEFEKVVSAIENFWFAVVEYPPNKSTNSGTDGV